ncbi:gp198 [Bacillus phage G]|uniref:Gp198 n=1 Tax=Bacillus phage G TaxID=2884420 RepID=G3MBR4_9CAUD|nr:gp198 [Bacillus phage G]AEO93940.1 gp198 [Bacillus phage G]
MNILVTICIIFPMLCVAFLPVGMMKFGIKMTGRDLFFMLIGMFFISGFTLIAILY